MYEIFLKNKKKFSCNEHTTILEAAKKQGVFLEHSCLSARCRSCVVKVLDGSTKNVQKERVLTQEEINENYVLSCNAKPTSDLTLDVEDLANITFYDKRIIPSKIDSIENLTKDVIKLTLRLPPSSNFNFISGQYVNLIKGGLKRSYSMANGVRDNSRITFYIKKYDKGLMSEYWFKEARINDLIRVEGPLGSFFYRKSEQTEIVFLATGTGVAPVKAIIEEIDNSSEDYSDKNFLILIGARTEKEFFWRPKIKSDIKFQYIPVLSRPNDAWDGERGYVQNVLLKQNVDLPKAQVYACGSQDMVESAREVLIQNSLPKAQFYSDSFVCTN